MAFRVIGVAVMCLFTSVVANSCKIQVNTENLAVFTQTLGKVEMLLDINSSIIDLEDEESINAYCYTPLSLSYQHRDYYGRSQIYHPNVTEDNFYCKKGNLFLESTEKNFGQSLTMSCKKTASYFEHNVKNCNETGVAYGLKLKGIPIVFAEFCYNMALTKVEFMHLRSGIRPQVLADQELFNPTLANYSLESDIQFEKIITDEDRKLKEAVNERFSEYPKLASFEIGPIWPSKNCFGLWNKYLSTLSILNAAPFWASLKYGNWATLGRALSSLSDDAKYDIYAGTSGAMPSSFGCKNGDQTPFTYYVSYKKRTIPMYIWNYIVDSNGSGDGVVIIGVNSPFVEFSAVNSSVIFCNDICDSYEWLNLLKNTRRIPTLGYIFCCSPKEARAKLVDLPVLEAKLYETNTEYTPEITA